MSHVEESGWGSWNEAERWRREAFGQRTALDRLAWLEDVWRLSRAASEHRAATDAVEPVGESRYR